MKVILNILRRPSPEAEPFWQKIAYETEDSNATVASALREINADGSFCDLEGKKVGEIRWEHSCLQKKCGACAMVIGGWPQLACGAFLRDFSKKKEITLEPLKKFPVVADLLVDRSILFENLKTLSLWSRENITLSEKNGDAYEASRCLQCGCCLEVCPNYDPAGGFFSAAGFVPSTRLLTELPAGEREEIRAAYREHIYAGCAKSLSCKEVCPAGIDTDRLLSRSNRIAVWRKR